MSKCIYGNTVGAGGLPKSYVLETEDGAQLIGVLVGEETVMTATANDIRKGKIAATENGIIEGEKDIPAYRTQRGSRLIKPNQAFSISLSNYDQYDYTQLQCMLAPFNTTISDSYAVDKVVIENGVYMTESTNKISDVTKNNVTKSIDLNITNDSDKIYFIYFFTYKEEE